jgi:hypothetical protein
MWCFESDQLMGPIQRQIPPAVHNTSGCKQQVLLESARVGCKAPSMSPSDLRPRQRPRSLHGLATRGHWQLDMRLTERRLRPHPLHGPARRGQWKVWTRVRLAGDPPHSDRRCRG